MREYGRVYSSFWQSQDIRELSEDGRTMAIYLMTCPHANLIGCFRLPDAYAADDLQWSSERVREGFVELEDKGFATRDEGSKWLVIHKYLKWNAFENGNVAIAASKAFDQVPSIPLKAKLAAALLEFGCHLKEPFANHLQTLLEPFANPEPDPEPEPEPILNQIQNLNPTGTTFAAPPAEDAAQPVKRAARKPKEPAPSAETWEAYASAYRRHYNADPVRNAMVNGQLAQIVGRLGAEEAPQVAAWYVGHQNRFYVGAGHSVGMLLKDCEKLRTEWATGRQTTAMQAIQADKTQTNFNAFSTLIAEAKAKETHAEY